MEREWKSEDEIRLEIMRLVREHPAVLEDDLKIELLPPAELAEPDHEGCNWRLMGVKGHPGRVSQIVMDAIQDVQGRWNLRSL
jgi:hypothetical protein